MQKILEPILVTIIFIGSYILNYSCFDTCLSDDVEFNYGKHKKRKIYKETHGFWRKFFLHRYKKNGKPMALRPVYCKFCRFCSYAYFGKYLCIERRKCIQMVVSYLWRSLLSVVCSSSICKMGLYRGNVVRSRKEYRKNNRK